LWINAGIKIVKNIAKTQPIAMGKIKDNGIDAQLLASVVYRSYMSAPTTSRYAIRFYF
jgi:hypothetical protein